VHEAFALGVGRAFQRGPFHAGLLREALQRARRLAVRVERDVEIRTEHFAALFVLFDSDTGQQHGEATRRIQRLGFTAIERDPAPGEPVDHVVEERLRQSGQRLDRQFLGAEFDQQRFLRDGHQATSAFLRPGKPSFSRCA
jgi:hypothetical protein